MMIGPSQRALMQEATRSDLPAFRWAQWPHVVILALALVVLWIAAEVLLLAFGGFLFSVFLNTLGGWVSRWTRLTYRWGLVVVVIVLVSLFGGATYFAGAHVAQQVNALSETLPRAIDEVRRWLVDHGWGNLISDSSAVVAGPSLGKITGMASHAVHLLIDLVLIAMVGLYFAIEPDSYSTGVMQLFPIARRPRVKEVMTAVTYNLRWWLLGQIGSMVVIAVLISIALWAIGAPLALALGFFAGAFEIIPNVGPIVWLVPALLIAILGGVQMVFQVFMVYCGLHLFESYVLVPIVQRQVVRLPPAISILAISLLTLTLGILGTMLAAPIAVVTLVIVKMVYIEDRLGDHEIEVPGNSTARS